MESNKRKILMGTLCGVSGLVLGAGVATGATIGILNSKNNKLKHLSVATKDVNIVANNMAAYWQFTLKDELKDNEEIVATCLDDMGKFNVQAPTVQGKLVTVPIYWLTPDSHAESQESTDITFTCRDKTTKKEKWSEIVDDCEVKYLPYVMYDGQKSEAGIVDEDNQVLTGTFIFDLPNGISKAYDGKLKAEVDYQKYKDESEFENIEWELEPNEEGTQATLTISGETTSSEISDGDSFEFDVQISCMYGDTDIPIWISSKFIDLCVLNNEEEVPIPAEYCTFAPYSEGSDYLTLTSVNIPADDDTKYNTLEIPVNGKIEGEEVEKPVIAIGNGTDQIAGLDSISKIKVPQGSYLTYFNDNALSGYSNIVYLDISNIPDDVSGLEEMDFGSENFTGWSTKGKIIWNSNFSQYKKHLVMTKLYAAGLTYVNWYNIKEVSNVSQLKEACDAGANIKLTADITIPYSADYTGQIDIRQSLVLDLNGKTITSAGPIANYDKKEFAIFGIWNGAEVVVTDTSEDHNGEIRAYDQTKEYGTGKTVDFAHMQMPTVPESGDPRAKENQWFVYRADKNSYTSREQRCFYIRTDTPSKARTSLDILAGKYYGNCTTVMNWNGVCWIEDAFSDSDEHKYAPEFHLYSPYSDYNPPKEGGTEIVIKDGTKEIINCDDSNAATGDARFEVWDAKFFGWEDDDQSWSFYDPKKAIQDNDHDWTAAYYYNELYGYDKYETIETEHREGSAVESYLLATTHLKQQ